MIFNTANQVFSSRLLDNKYVIKNSNSKSSFSIIVTGLLEIIKLYDRWDTDTFYIMKNNPTNQPILGGKLA